MVGGAAFGWYAAGDLFRVAIENGAVVYRKNGVALHTSAIAPTYPLRFVGLTYHGQASIAGVQVFGAGNVTANAFDGQSNGILAMRVRDGAMFGPSSAVYLGPSFWKPAGCSFAFTPASVIGVARTGGTGTIAVATQPGCEWTAGSNVSWISTGSQVRSGSDQISYDVSENQALPSRTGTLTIGGQPITISQRGFCEITLTPGGQSFPLNGGSGHVTVTTNLEECGWGATSSASWVLIEPHIQTTGSGSFLYTVESNPTGDQRSATITVREQVFQVTQAPNCIVTLSDSLAGTILTPGGGTGTLTLTANGSACGWSLTSHANWLTISGSLSGTGSATRSYTAATNYSSAARAGGISVPGSQVVVTQYGIPSDLILNGDFELGFHTAAAGYGSGQVANDWGNFTNSNHDTSFQQAWGAPDDEQKVENAGRNDGIYQYLAMPPGITYELAADIFVYSGSVRLGLGTSVSQAERFTTRLGAQRVRIQVTGSLPYAPNNALVSVNGWDTDGSSFRVDHVSLRQVQDVTERVVNGYFENGFYPFGDVNGSGMLGNYWTHLGQSTPPSGVFDPGGPNSANSNFWQNVDGGSFGTGLEQTISLQAGQKYVVQANVLVSNNGGVNLSIGPIGTVAVQRVYACGPSSTWHELAMLYTAPYTGQFTVGVKSHIAQTLYSVDDITVAPSSRTYVQPYTGGTGTECIQMHPITLAVHAAGSLAPVEGALVEIIPNYGNPSRITYPDGTVTYTAGAGPLSYVVSKSGFFPKSGLIDLTGVQTLAVELQSTSGGGGGGGGGGGSDPGGDCIYDFAAVGAQDTALRMAILTNPNCPWTATSNQAGITISPASGMGPAEITIDVAPDVLNDAGETVDIQIVGYTIHLANQPPSSHPYGFRIPIPIPVPCIDSRLPWCVIVIDVSFPGSGGDQNNNTPPEFACLEVIERGTTIVCGLKANTGNEAQMSNWRFTTVDGRTITRSSRGTDAGSQRIWSGTMVKSGTLSVDLVWGSTAKPINHKIEVRARDWLSRLPEPVPVPAGYLPQLALDDPPMYGSAAGKFLATHDEGSIREIEGGPNRGYSYVARQPEFFAFWAGSAAMFEPGSANYDAFELANCGSYSPTNPLGFATAQQARESIRLHEAGTQNSHWAFYAEALAHPPLNLGQIAEPFVEFGPVTQLRSVVGPRLDMAWFEVMSRGGVEPCNSLSHLLGPDAFVRGPSCEALGRWNVYTPPSTPFKACP